MPKNRAVTKKVAPVNDFDKIVSAQVRKAMVEAPNNPNGGARMPVSQAAKPKDKRRNKEQYMAIFDREAKDSDDELNDWEKDTEDMTGSPEKFVHDDDGDFEQPNKLYAQGPDLYDPFTDEEGFGDELAIDDVNALYDKKGGVKKLRKGEKPYADDLDDDYVGMSDDDDDLGENDDDDNDDDDSAWDDDGVDDDEDDDDDFGNDDDDDDDNWDDDADDDADDDKPAKKPAKKNVKKSGRRLHKADDVDDGADDDDEVVDPDDDDDDDWENDGISEEDEHPQARKGYSGRSRRPVRKSVNGRRKQPKRRNAKETPRRREVRKALGSDALEFVDGSPFVKALVDAIMDWRDDMAKSLRATHNEMVGNLRAQQLENRRLRKGMNNLAKLMRLENRQVVKSLASAYVQTREISAPEAEVNRGASGKPVRKGYGGPITTTVREVEANGEFNLAKALDVLEGAYQNNTDGISMRDITILENDRSPQYLSNNAIELLTKSHLL